jgi:putative SOS response-associated peptidase YedK
MCGRYAIITPPDELKAAFGYPDLPNFPPRYNIAPTQPVPVVNLAEGMRRFTLMRWGFIPGWVKDLKAFPLINNIRSETAREKASFRAAFMRRRALMPADGFYEWQRMGKARRAFYIHRPDNKPFAFAALWETWATSDGSELDTAAMLTTHANGLISAIHDRAPVVVLPRDYNRWLDPMTTAAEAESMLRPPPDGFFEMTAVSDAVNKVANDGPELHAAAQPSESQKPTLLKPEPETLASTKAQGDLF